MKKDKETKKINIDEDFNESCLPHTRKEQFKYLFLNKFAKTITIGGLLALFALPALAISIIKIYRFSSIYSSYTSSQVEEMMLAMRNSFLLFDGIQIIGLIIFALGLAGAIKVIKKLCFDEILFIKTDFLSGIKENGKQLAIMSLFFSIVILVYNYLNMTASLTGNQTMKILVIVFLSLYGFTIIPIFTLMIPSISVYKNSFGTHFKNCAVMVLKHYFPYVGISSIFVVGIITLYLIANAVSNGGLFIPIALFIIVYLFPLYLIGNELYAFSRFDMYINKEYPSIYRKGLSKEE